MLAKGFPIHYRGRLECGRRGVAWSASEAKIDGGRSSRPFSSKGPPRGRSEVSRAPKWSRSPNVYQSHRFLSVRTSTNRIRIIAATAKSSLPLNIVTFYAGDRPKSRKTARPGAPGGSGGGCEKWLWFISDPPNRFGTDQCSDISSQSQSSK